MRLEHSVVHAGSDGIRKEASVKLDILNSFTATVQQCKLLTLQKFTVRTSNLKFDLPGRKLTCQA